MENMAYLYAQHDPNINEWAKCSVELVELEKNELCAGNPILPEIRKCWPHKLHCA